METPVNVITPEQIASGNEQIKIRYVQDMDDMESEVKNKGEFVKKIGRKQSPPLPDGRALVLIEGVPTTNTLKPGDSVQIKYAVMTEAGHMATILTEQQYQQLIGLGETASFGADASGLGGIILDKNGTSFPLQPLGDNQEDEDFLDHALVRSIETCEKNRQQTELRKTWEIVNKGMDTANRRSRMIHNRLASSTPMPSFSQHATVA